MGRIYLCDLLSIFISKMVSSVNKVEVNREKWEVDLENPLSGPVCSSCVWLCE